MFITPVPTHERVKMADNKVQKVYGVTFNLCYFIFSYRNEYFFAIVNFVKAIICEQNDLRRENSTVRIFYVPIVHNTRNHHHQHWPNRRRHSMSFISGFAIKMNEQVLFGQRSQNTLSFFLQSEFII